MKNPLALSIEGMHCAACVRRVTNALQGVSGVEPASVEVGSAKLTYDPQQATPEEIVSAVNRIGFQAIVR
ncbi:MAG TPA: heavy-metal-associated domain-containing protein [Granulicella sp.]